MKCWVLIFMEKSEHECNALQWERFNKLIIYTSVREGSFLQYNCPGNTTNDRLSGQTSLKKSISNVQPCSFLIKAYKDIHYTISIPFATMQCQTLCLFSPFMPGNDFRSIYLARNNWTSSCVAIAMHISDQTLLGQFSGYCSTCQDLYLHHVLSHLLRYVPTRAKKWKLWPTTAGTAHLPL